MPKVIDENGQEYYTTPECMSSRVYEAYISGKSWNPESYIVIRVESVIPVWVTISEREEFLRLVNSEDINRFIDNLNTKSIPKDDFYKWMLGEKQK